MKLRIATCLIAFCLAPAALAQSSIALGQPDNVARDGVSFGIAYNQPDHDAADARAMAECRNGPDVTPAARDRCAVIVRFDNRCVAIALDPRAGTHGFGWAVFDRQEDADDVAIANCRATAREQRDYCVITTRRCDGRGGR